MNTTITTSTRVLLALGVAALVTLAATTSAGAKPLYSPSTVEVGGGGQWTTSDDGDIIVTGPALVLDWRKGDRLPATLTATLEPADGTLPEPDTCEPASATFIVEGERYAMTMAGVGTVCAVVVPFAPWVVTQEFDGIYTIIDSSRHTLRGDDGSFSLTLTQTGYASAHATDFIPEP